MAVLVVAEGNAVVPFALVTAQIGNATYSEYCDSDGMVVFRFAQEGELQIGVDGLQILSNASLWLDDSAKQVTVRVTGTASVSGAVLLHGVPVRDATVTIDQKRSVVTDQDGRYFFGAVAPGIRSFVANSRSSEAASSLTELHLAAGENKQDFVINLDCSASIAGIVENQLGMAVVGVDVLWACATCPDYTHGQTDSGGRFRLPRLRGGGNYSAIVRSMTGAAFPHNVPFPTVSLGDGERADGVRLIINDDLSSIRGRVVGEDHQPVGQVDVLAVPPSTNMPRIVVSRSTTDTRGEFSLTDLPVGKYTVAVGRTGDSGRVDNVATGRDDLVIEIPAVGTVHGHVQGFGGDPVVVTLLGGTLTHDIATVDHVNSNFEFAGVTRGQHWVMATSMDLGAVAPISVDPVAAPDLELRAGNSQVAGRVEGVKPGDQCACLWMVDLPGIGDTALGYFAPNASGKFSIRVVSGLAVSIACDSGALHGRLVIGEVLPEGVDGQVIQLARKP